MTREPPPKDPASSRPVQPRFPGRLTREEIRATLARRQSWRGEVCQ